MSGVALRPIPTEHRGYLFRSRLEARWAVFYDHLGVAYRYEDQGYDLGGRAGLYLPDFWLPDHGCYVEVKPTLAAARTVASKARELARQSGNRVYVFFGDCWVPEYESESAYLYDPEGGRAGRGVYWDHRRWWCECLTCGRLGIQFEGRANRIDCPCPKDADRPHNHKSPRLLAAYLAARRARFASKENP